MSQAESHLVTPGAEALEKTVAFSEQIPEGAEDGVVYETGVVFLHGNFIRGIRYR